MNTPVPKSLTQQILEQSALTSAFDPIDVTQVETLLAQHYRMRGDLRRLSSEKDETFRLRTDSGDYLVKVSSPDEAEVVVAFQTALMRSLEDVAPKLPAQRVRLTVDGTDNVAINVRNGPTRYLRVLNFVEGVFWAQTSPSRDQLVELGEMLARVDLGLKTFAHPADERMLVFDIRHFHKLTELVAYTTRVEHRQLAQRAFQIFHSAIVPRLGDLEIQVIHGDFTPYNVVVEPKGTRFVKGVIDFGDAVRSALIFDPAVSIVHLLGRTPDHPWIDACAFLAGFEQARPLKDSELSLLPVAALARLTLLALMKTWRAERTPEQRDHLLTGAADYWIKLEQAMSVPLDDVIAQMRAQPS